MARGNFLPLLGQKFQQTLSVLENGHIKSVCFENQAHYSHKLIIFCNNDWKMFAVFF